ncbi:rCG35662 [Rattus norvegicus]|uniref:RCG35662 n=1 Tax=Rattus norvegicus TaxID=10116 RepID=A6KF68_RAT|nr:rCG35662 [Rattus norvegicus]
MYTVHSNTPTFSPPDDNRHCHQVSGREKAQENRQMRK